MDLDPCVTGSLAFQTGTHDRGVRKNERYRLTLHVRSHERTVGIIMLKEGDQRGGKSHDLVGRHVHVFHFRGFKDGEVTRLTGFHGILSEFAFFVQRHIRLGDLGQVFLFSTQISEVLGIHLTAADPAIRSFNETHIIDLGVYAKGGDQTDVRTFRGLNGTETTVV